MSQTQDSPDSTDFEKCLTQLQEIVRRLESGSLSLEDSLKDFEAGVRLTRTCQQLLTQAEKRIEILTQNDAAQAFKKEPFSP